MCVLCVYICVCGLGVYVCMHSCLHARIHAYVNVCVYMHKHIHIRCRFVHVFTHSLTLIHRHADSYMHYLPLKHLHQRLFARVSSFIRIHTCIHTCYTHRHAYARAFFEQLHQCLRVYFSCSHTHHNCAQTHTHTWRSSDPYASVCLDSSKPSISNTILSR